MSVRIKASYTDEAELARLQERLAPGVERCRLPREQKGRYKRAYIDWDSDAINQGQDEHRAKQERATEQPQNER